MVHLCSVTANTSAWSRWNWWCLPTFFLQFLALTWLNSQANRCLHIVPDDCRPFGVVAVLVCLSVLELPPVIIDSTPPHRQSHRHPKQWLLHNLSLSTPHNITKTPKLPDAQCALAVDLAAAAAAATTKGKSAAKRVREKERLKESLGCNAAIQCCCWSLQLFGRRLANITSLPLPTVAFCTPSTAHFCLLSKECSLSLTRLQSPTHTHTFWAHLTLTQRNANDASLFRFGRSKRKKKTRCENVGKREEKRKANESSDAAELCSQWVQCLTKKHWNSPTENVSVLCVCVSRRFAGRLVVLMFATSGKNASK